MPSENRYEGPLTDALRRWVRETMNVDPTLDAEDASEADETYRTSIARALRNGELTKAELDAMASSSRAKNVVQDFIRAELDKRLGRRSAQPADDFEPISEEALDRQLAAIEKSSERIADEMLAARAARGELEDTRPKRPSPHIAVFAASQPAETRSRSMPYDRVDLKDPAERFSDGSYVAKHARWGTPVKGFDGEYVRQPSARDDVRAGCWFKFLMAKSGVPDVVLTDFDREVISNIFKGDKFVGKLGNEWTSKGESVPGQRVKALLDDSTSGGQELNPIWFDDMIVTFPLLFGELVPQVDLRMVPRGSSIEGASIGNPTVTWGQSEGSSITLFDTTSLAAALDSTVHAVMVAVEVGKDLAADSPADIGATLSRNIGMRFQEELDRVVANGIDGSGEPTGIFQTSGSTIVSSANGTSGPITIGDLESLLFGLAKQYRTGAHRPAFVSSDTTYRRARAIAISGTDQRRVLGMEQSTHRSYSALGYDWLIQNDIAENDAAFVDMSVYRLYRRQGFGIEMHTQGETLARKNTMLIVARGRFAGRVVDANGVAEANDFPTTDG